MRKLETHKKHSEEFDVAPAPTVEKVIYIPPMTHPWKLASFRLQMAKSHQKHIYT